MGNWVKWLLVLPCAALASWSGAGAAADEPVKPIRALLVTGGCCHDYTKQKKILPEGISARAPVEWTVVQQGGSTTNTKIELYENPDWSKGYDVVVHNECFAAVEDPAWTERIIKPHREGLASVVVHCAMHCYRDKTDEWFKYVGVTSHRHGAQYPYEVVNIAKDDPVMAGFGASWTTPKGELYQIAKLWDTATPLAHAMSKETKKFEPVIWKNTYGKGLVFGTTIGHHNETMSEPAYLDFMTRGLLWSVGKLDAAHLKPLDKAASKAKDALVPENLAAGKQASASTSQGGHDPADAVDGEPDSRWCASNDELPQWWQVDLGKPEDLTGCRIVWESGGVRYVYDVQGSADGKTWTKLGDQGKGDDGSQEREHRFDAKGIRYVRVNVTGTEPGHWASVFEVDVLGTRKVAGQAHVRRDLDPAGILKGVKAPPGFDVTLFAGPKDVHYPTCLAASPEGVLFVGVDENGSIDRKEGRGRVVRCVDEDGDGKADSFNVFATMDSPRGVIYDDGTLYVLHPPDLTAYHDDDRDGKADRSETLVKGIGFDLKFRGADHTTNGIRLGIDGWIYIAVGDYGYIKAEGKDGTTLQLRGGGVSRVRTDGTGLEVYSRGQRNIYDVAVDPYLNAFTRDNTNDGGGWDVRLSHIIPTGHYGYPSLFVNFPDEIVPPLADYGGGSPTGSIYVQEPGLPPGFGDTLYTCEWGRGGVFRHPLTPDGAGFKAGQEMFVELPRPTDMDVDGRSRMYISTWRDGGFTYSKPEVGYVIRVTARGGDRPAFPDLRKSSDERLLKHLVSDSQVLRLAAQREILRRGAEAHPIFYRDLFALPLGAPTLAGRVAAIFTLEQMPGRSTIPLLMSLPRRDDIHEFILRALADRKGDARVPAAPFVDALTSPNPRVRLQAVVGLGRLGRREEAAKVVPLTADPDRLVAHAAVKALVALDASDACLAALAKGDSRLIPGSVQALQAFHDKKTVDGLISTLGTARDEAVRRGCLKALCRLYHREAEYTGDWWTTRPDTSGPYYKHVTWDQSDRIGQALRKSLAGSDSATARWLLAEMIRNKLDFEETTTVALRAASEDPAFRSTLVDLLRSRHDLPAEAIAFLDGVAGSDQAAPVVRAKALRVLEKQEKHGGAREALIRGLSSVALLARPDNDLLGPLLDYARDARHTREAASFVKLAEGPDPGRRILAYAVLIQADADAKVPADAKAAASKAIERAWAKPETAAGLLRAIGLTRAGKYGLQVRAHAKDASPLVQLAAADAAIRLDLDRATGPKSGPLIARLPFNQVIAEAVKDKGDPALGGRLFEKQGCIACHTISKSEGLKGPFLGDITTRYSRAEIAESILKPSARISQGFETQKFATTSGQVFEGFVVRESGDEVELRNAAGAVTVLPKSSIDERGKTETSVMPVGLADQLTVPELASIMAYLESLRGK